MIDRRLIKTLFCVAVVAAVMLPFGQELFPYVSHVLSGTQFQAIEAIVSATVGFGISAIVG
jgi:membrane protein YqaA with SNARE-associated domain